MATAPRIALALALLSVAGCAPRVPAAPHAARTQAPHAGPTTAWRGRGRFVVEAPGTRIDADFVVRADPGDATRAPSVRLVLLTDTGVQLADVSWSAAGADVHRAVPDLAARAPALARLLDPWLPAAPTAARRWSHGRLIERGARVRRWYGGDPLLLRRVDGGGWPLMVADYRPLDGFDLAREIVADGPATIALRLRLVEARLETR